MKLGVNIIRLTRAFTGVGRYIECVLKEWSQMEIPFEKIILYTHTPLNQDKVVFPLDHYECVTFGKKLPDPMWEWRDLRRQADNIDILFCPSYTIPIGYPGMCVVANHGPTENDFFSFQWWRSQAYELLYKYSAHKANRIIANSHSVKRRLTDVYGISQKKIDVIHLAASSSFQPIADKNILMNTRKKYFGGDHLYILFVGKLAKRHYIPNLIQAFAELYKKHSFICKLLIVGPDYLNLNVQRMAENLDISDAVLHIPYVKHTDLPPLYNAAEFFVYPSSESEGFGIPVIEAMACGTPVLTVNQGSLSEFAPGAAHLVKTSSTEHLKSGLERMLFDESLRKDLIHKGIERAKTITWKKTAEKTMEILWKVANK